MANMRPAYAATECANFDWSEISERPIDRIAAAGFVDCMGLLLWKAIYNNDSRALDGLYKGLIKHFMERYKRENQENVQRIVIQCLHEYFNPKCPSCRGTAEAMIGELRTLCKTCDGTGLRHYSDSDRSISMQISYARTKLAGHKLKWLSAEISKIDKVVNTVMNQQLERRK